MCGIVASWDRRGVAVETLIKSLASLRHRGPDGRGLWQSLDGEVALGHTRLAVIDSAGSSQPIVSEDGERVLVVNGELYDYEPLRLELQRRGHRFRTDGDSEIALHLFEEYGLKFVHHLRGEFALVLWDGLQRKLIAVRDRFGIKPLCYHYLSGNCLFLASEAKALFELGVPRAWHADAFFQVASMQYTRPEQTLFAGISQLRPGHLLVADRTGLTVQPYWDLDYPRREGIEQSKGDFGEQLLDLLQESVCLRLRADGPLCFHLSGGLDSTAVVALATEHLAQPVDCFTVAFAEPDYNELEQAERSACEMGVRLHPVHLNQAELAEHLSDAIWFSEGLAINGHLPAKYLLARAIHRAGFKVVLSGEGSDELFGGYAHFREDLLYSSGGDVTELRKANPTLAGMHLAEGMPLPLDGVRAELEVVPAFLHAKATLGRRMQTLLSEDFRIRFGARDPLHHFVAAFDIPGQLTNRHPVDRASYLWARSSLANYILRTLGDGTEMAHSVEGRLPFLDHQLFALARTIPVAFKINQGFEKWVLREALRGLVPEETRIRPKHPFTAPPASVFGEELLQDVLRSRLVAEVPFFDPGQIVRVLDQLNGSAGRERIAWDPVLMLALSACLLQERFGLCT